jgi:hypothetical protein
MFKKVCFSPESDAVSTHTSAEISANPKLVERMTKLANGIKTIAPRSDDFLYFSIIFLKAAESATLDDSGLIKKTSSGDNAWGFFDENWKWHGNVKPHRNNNNDIFPESELKIAAKKWIGMPLCRDHESSSVDGIRGIILDAHYDEKFKQIIGLCALDKINYPDLARKVETGLVRYGSMGTAVETSICSDCGNRAQTQKEYCEHVNNRLAHGEINVGLKPIEYSLVVQPAEPGAVLLKCIASLQGYRQELSNYGVDNVDEMLGKLSFGQAQHLEGIMKTACGDTGCSISERKKIVRSFLKNNSLLKESHSTGDDSGESFANTGIAGLSERLRSATEAAKALADPDVPEDARKILSSLMNKLKLEEKLEDEGQLRGEMTSRPQDDQESFTSGENTEGAIGAGGVPLFSAAPSNSQTSMLGGGDTGNRPDFPPDDDILSFDNPSGGEAVTVESSRRNHSIKVANNDLDNDYVDDFSINSIMEDIMNESRLRKRAELRRRIAYMQGGAEGVEPNTYKSETWDRDQDKQMKQTGNMGGTDGMAPGDKETKEKLSRAELKQRRLKRLAYMQGGAEGVEPNTYKSETWDRNQDKQMQQTGNMGGTDGTFPGDKETKEKLSRAAYNGPALRTRFSVRRRTDGSVDRGNSVFEVFAGDRRVIAATAGQIYQDELAGNWEWISSQEYGREVCSQIRQAGLDKVSSLLKTAQEAPPLDDMGGAPPDLPPLDDMGGAPPDLPPLDDMGGAPPDLPPLDDAGAPPEEEEDLTPSEEIENRLADMEGLLDEIRDFVSKLEDERLADVDVNVFTGKGKEGETVEAGDGGLGALSSELISGLKTAYRRLDGSADELSLVAETYDNISKLSSGNRKQFVKLASAAVKDADHLTGESRGLMKVARSVMEDMAQDGSFADDADDADDATDFLTFADSNDADDNIEDGDGDSADDYIDDGAVDSADDNAEDLVAEAMSLRKARRESLLKQAENRFLSERAASRENILKQAEGSHVSDEVAEDALDEDVIVATENRGSNLVKSILDSKVAEKRVDEERENYRIKLRRAYDVGLEMQRKGLLAHSKTALDKQVDEIMTFDGNAFEAFKRSIGNARAVGSVKIASDLGGVNIGVEPDQVSSKPTGRLTTADTLTSMWE